MIHWAEAYENAMRAEASAILERVRARHEQQNMEMKIQLQRMETLRGRPINQSAKICHCCGSREFKAHNSVEICAYCRVERA